MKNKILKHRFKGFTRIVACTLLCLCATAAHAQLQADGVVVDDEFGEPLPGAAIQVLGHTDMGVVADAQGRFTISVPRGSVLRFTFIGMSPTELPARRNMRVTLQSADKKIDEVMVVAFGTAKKSAFTGSAAVVKADDINKVQVDNPLDALNGRAAGVQMTSVSGQPGMATSGILVRGINSINAGTAPLIVLDGAPFDGDLSTISNQDIESMTVLKDAASAALYGARGANGVIIITTKRGQRGQNGQLTVDAKVGVNMRSLPDYNTVTSPAKYYEMWYQGLNAYAQDKLHYDSHQAHAFANQNLTAQNSYGLAYNVYTVPQGENMIGTNGRLNPNARLGNVISYNGAKYMLTPDNWTDAIYTNGLRQEYTVTAASSGQSSTFFASVNYLNNQGITLNSDFNRLSARLKADTQLNSWLHLAANVSYAHYSSNSITGDGSTGSTDNMFSYTQIAPIYPLYIRDAAGKPIISSHTGLPLYDYGYAADQLSSVGLTRPYLYNSNPLCANQLDMHRNEGNMFGGTVTAEARFLGDFKFTSVNTVNSDEARSNTTMNPYYGQYSYLNGWVSVGHLRTWAYNMQQLLSWAHDYGKHSVEAMAGHEYYRSHYYSLSGSKTNQFAPSNPELDGAVVSGSPASATTDYNVEGWLARAQYNYDMRYFASASVRCDASSRFHPDNRWGAFYSLGAAWLINKEKWFQAKWVNELKFKASYGEQGNDNIGAYRYTNTYVMGNVNNTPAIMESSYAGNKDISWEKNANFNMGIEFAVLNNRLSGSIEYFYRKTSDMLFSLPLTPSLGYTNKWCNVGDMRNSGIEIELNADIIRTRDLLLGARLNLTSYSNRITRLPHELVNMQCDGSKGYSSGTYFYAEGLPLSTAYMPSYAGVDPNTGEALYWRDITDAAGKVVGQQKTADYSTATYHLQGTTLPSAYGGFGLNLSWKGLDVGIDFTYQIGGQVYDNTYAHQMAMERGRAFNTDLLDAWTPQNRNTNVPRIQFNDSYMAAASNRFLTDASYLTLQNINIGYTLPVKYVAKLGIQKLRVYFNADNLWLWSKRQGLDPRQSVSGGNTSEVYAPMRTISGGVTLTI